MISKLSSYYIGNVGFIYYGGKIFWNVWKKKKKKFNFKLRYNLLY